MTIMMHDGSFKLALNVLRQRVLMINMGMPNGDKLANTLGKSLNHRPLNMIRTYGQIQTCK
jgi:hypothetical protein